MYGIYNVILLIYLGSLRRAESIHGKAHLIASIVARLKALVLIFYTRVQNWTGSYGISFWPVRCGLQNRTALAKNLSCSYTSKQNLNPDCLYGTGSIRPLIYQYKVCGVILMHELVNFLAFLETLYSSCSFSICIPYDYLLTDNDMKMYIDFHLQ